MHCTAATLHEFAANPQWLGGVGAFSLVLHTWTQDLRRHCGAPTLHHGECQWVDEAEVVVPMSQAVGGDVHGRELPEPASLGVPHHGGVLVGAQQFEHRQGQSLSKRIAVGGLGEQLHDMTQGARSGQVQVHGVIAGDRAWSGRAAVAGPGKY